MVLEVKYVSRNTVIYFVYSGFIHIFSPVLTTHAQFNTEEHISSRIGQKHRQRQESVSLPYPTRTYTQIQVQVQVRSASNYSYHKVISNKYSIKLTGNFRIHEHPLTHWQHRNTLLSSYIPDPSFPQLHICTFDRASTTNLNIVTHQSLSRFVKNTKSRSFCSVRALST